MSSTQFIPLASSTPLLTTIWVEVEKDEFGFLNLTLNHGELSRATYSAAWKKIQESGESLLSDVNWEAEVAANSFCDSFSSGDGLNTFRVPLRKKKDGLIPYLKMNIVEGEYNEISFNSFTDIVANKLKDSGGLTVGGGGGELTRSSILEALFPPFWNSTKNYNIGDFYINPEDTTDWQCCKSTDQTAPYFSFLDEPIKTEDASALPEDAPYVQSDRSDLRWYSNLPKPINFSEETTFTTFATTGLANPEVSAGANTWVISAHPNANTVTPVITGGATHANPRKYVKNSQNNSKVEVFYSATGSGTSGQQLASMMLTGVAVPNASSRIEVREKFFTVQNKYSLFSAYVRNDNIAVSASGVITEPASNIAVTHYAVIKDFDNVQYKYIELSTKLATTTNENFYYHPLGIYNGYAYFVPYGAAYSFNDRQVKKIKLDTWVVSNSGRWNWNDQTIQPHLVDYKIIGNWIYSPNLTERIPVSFLDSNNYNPITPTSTGIEIEPTFYPYIISPIKWRFLSKDRQSWIDLDLNTGEFTKIDMISFSVPAESNRLFKLTSNGNDNYIISKTITTTFEGVNYRNTNSWYSKNLKNWVEIPLSKFDVATLAAYQNSMRPGTVVATPLLQQSLNYYPNPFGYTQHKEMTELKVYTTLLDTTKFFTASAVGTSATVGITGAIPSLDVQHKQNFSQRDLNFAQIKIKGICKVKEAPFMPGDIIPIFLPQVTNGGDSTSGYSLAWQGKNCILKSNNLLFYNTTDTVWGFTAAGAKLNLTKTSWDLELTITVPRGSILKQWLDFIAETS